MYSECDNCCSQQLGFPIRTSPDHGLLASPRSLSQLVTSFIAYLRQGIHTHALSSLTIKLTLDTIDQLTNRLTTLLTFFTSAPRRILVARRDCNLCCPSIFNCQRSKASVQKPGVGTLLGFRLLNPEAWNSKEYRIRGMATTDALPTSPEFLVFLVFHARIASVYSAFA